ncbi:transglutaminase-like domain-containing protein [Agromyces salentinus]|uniref:Transglutaminase-like domain-containing protein n=1 Tax=Agromyces salentinus TaxID=269421 RepID=A0ABP4Z4X9_9MICO|nr:transglutaminase-like domain-containing protein [Agromyces salentinus]
MTFPPHAATETVDRFRTHSDLTEPGPHSSLLRDLGTDDASLHLTVTNLIDHYRATPGGVGSEQMHDIDRRWIAALLDALADRRPGPLDTPREASLRAGGCCRDHSLLAVAVLREHRIAARTRLGFAGYFTPGYFHDHVVVERWDDGGNRWRRFDPELDQGGFDFRVDDLPRGEAGGFRTAAEAWVAHRSGLTDLSDHGVGPDTPYSGPDFVHAYVLADLAHRQRCELLLWDAWGAMAAPGEELDGERLDLADVVADLTIRADAGDPRAEAELDALWARDARLRPGRFVETHSPTGRTGTTDLVGRTTVWRTASTEPTALET